MNPSVDLAVFETARGGILREGLAFDYCDVAVVTNIGEGDHLGLSDINTPEELAKVKRCIVEAVSPTGYAVLNAADPLVADMASKCPGGVLFFAIDPSNPVIVRHRSVGGRAAFVRDHHIVLANGEKETVVISLDRLPLTRNGLISFQVENSLASIAAAWSLGLPIDLIRVRAELIAADVDKVPGRFNVLEIEGATVVIDYGHNTHSLSAVIAAIGKFPHTRRTCVYSTAGDRRDIDIVRQGELLGEAFDKVILFEDHYLRGRAKGEIISLFRKGLESASRAKEIVEIDGANKACEAALDAAQSGDLILMQADTIDETMQWLKEYLAARVPADVPEIEEPASKSKLDGIQTPAAASKTISPAAESVLVEAQTIVKA
jgi:cyanophycin synthetase